MTVDWSDWLNKTPAEQDATWERYRKIVREEAEDARFGGYARMWVAILRADQAMRDADRERWRRGA